MRPNRPYIDEHGHWKSERNLALQHRASMHDYKSHGVYMITLTTNGRKPLFGNLDVTSTTILPTALGLLVMQEWHAIPSHVPQISMLDFQLMPDHLHGLLRVTAPLKKPLGQIIRSYKMRCTSLYRALMHDAGEGGKEKPTVKEGKASLTISQRKEMASHSLWEPSYNDRIAYSKQRLETLRAYIHDNPRRLAEKRKHPSYFALMQNVNIPTPYCQLRFRAMGNMDLLDAPQKQVIQCSRSLTGGNHEAEYRALMHDAMERAKNGAVSISAAISKGEQYICRAIRELKLPLIIMMKDGFPKPEDPHAKYYKPGGVLFEACAKGHLLLMEPTMEVFEIGVIEQAVHGKSPTAPIESDRYRFLALNEIARIIARGRG